MEFGSKLIRTVNQNIKEIYEEYNKSLTDYERLLLRIKEVKSLFEPEDLMQSRIDMLICKLNQETCINYKICKVVSNDRIVSILCDNMIKPKVEKIKSDYIASCDHKIEVSDTQYKNFLSFLDLNSNFEFVLIEDELIMNSIFDKISKNNTFFYIKLYTHDYRCFEPFTCFLLLITDENIYLIDTLKIRKLDHKIFRCGYEKIFCCKVCISQFEREFGTLGCYNFDKPYLESIFIDWRIRPIHNLLKDAIKSDIHYLKENFVNKKENDCENVDFNIPLEKELYFIDNPEFDLITSVFIRKYNISIELNELVNSFLKLRYFIAKSNDESLQYVMTDYQLLTLLCRRPQQREDFKIVLNRMSALTREYMEDFLLLMREDKKDGDELPKYKSILKNDIGLAENESFQTESISKIEDSEIVEEEEVKGCKPKENKFDNILNHIMPKMRYDADVGINVCEKFSEDKNKTAINNENNSKTTKRKKTKRSLISKKGRYFEGSKVEKKKRPKKLNEIVINENKSNCKVVNENMKKNISMIQNKSEGKVVDINTKNNKSKLNEESESIHEKVKNSKSLNQSMKKSNKMDRNELKIENKNEDEYKLNSKNNSEGEDKKKLKKLKKLKNKRKNKKKHDEKMKLIDAENNLKCNNTSVNPETQKTVNESTPIKENVDTNIVKNLTEPKKKLKKKK